jgi:hypothetical protein
MHAQCGCTVIRATAKASDYPDRLCELQTVSLCDSTEVQIDDEETLSRLWAILLPSHGRWHDAHEPGRSALLLRALVAHLQHPSSSTLLRLPVRMRPAASAPAPLRSFNQNRLRLRYFASFNHRMSYPSDALSMPYHEARDPSITDGVPSLSQISSTTSHHSNETCSPRAPPAPSTPNGTLTFSEPILHPISPSSFGPLWPAGTNKNNPSMPMHARTRSDDTAPGAAVSPATSPPQPHSCFLITQPVHTAQKSKTAASSIANGAPPRQLHSVLQQLSEDVDALLQGQESSQGDALRQLQTASSHLSIRMLRPVDSVHASHHASTRSPAVPMHLAAVAEDASSEDRLPAILDSDPDALARSLPTHPAQSLNGSAFARPGMHNTATGSTGGMGAGNGRDRQLSFSRLRRKVAGLIHPQHRLRFAHQRSESFAGVHNGPAESARHSGSQPSSPAADSGCAAVHSMFSNSIFSNALYDGQHQHCTGHSDGMVTSGELQTEALVSLGLPTSPAKKTHMQGFPVTGSSMQVSAEARLYTGVEAAAASCGQEYVSCEVMRQSSVCGECMQAVGMPAGGQIKTTHRVGSQGCTVIGEKIQQQAAGCDCGSAVGGGLLEANNSNRAESATMHSTFDVLADLDGERSCSAFECSRKEATNSEMDRLRSLQGAEAWHQIDSGEGRDVQDGDQIDAGCASEGCADVEEDSVPLVHALVLRVLHQFRMSKGEHDTAPSAAPFQP